MIYLWMAIILWVFFQVPKLLNQQLYKELAVLLLLSIFAGLYGTLVILRFPIPNAVDILLAIGEYIPSEVLEFFAL